MQTFSYDHLVAWIDHLHDLYDGRSIEEIARIENVTVNTSNLHDKGYQTIRLGSELVITLNTHHTRHQRWHWFMGALAAERVREGVNAYDRMLVS